MEIPGSSVLQARGQVIWWLFLDVLGNKVHSVLCAEEAQNTQCAYGSVCFLNKEAVSLTRGSQKCVEPIVALSRINANKVILMCQCFCH